MNSTGQLSTAKPRPPVRSRQPSLRTATTTLPVVAIVMTLIAALALSEPIAEVATASEPRSTRVDDREQRWVLPEVDFEVEDTLGEGVSRAVVVQSEEEAINQDLELWAAARGVTVDAARLALEHEVGLDSILVLLGEQYSDIYAGAFTERDRQGRASSTIRIKGEVPAEIVAVIEKSELDVAIVGGSPASWIEMTRVALLTATYLNDDEGVASTVMARASADEIQVWTPHMSDRDFEALQQRAIRAVGDQMATDAAISLLRPALESSESLDLNQRYVELRVAFAMASPGVDLRNGGEHTYGGGEAEDGGVRECTTAFTVNLPAGGTGVLTAAHCIGIDGYDDQNTAPYGMPWWDEHVGANGDLEVHTSPHVEPDDFWANDGVLRDVSSVHPAWTFNEGDSACVYGRSTNDRDCSSDIMTPYICYFPDSRQACNVIAMDAHVTAPGDSGGNWSWGNQAYGVHSGREPSLGVSVWTPVNLVSNEWPGMSVRT